MKSNLFWTVCIRQTAALHRAAHHLWAVFWVRTAVEGHRNRGQGKGGNCPSDFGRNRNKTFSFERPCNTTCPPPDYQTFLRPCCATKRFWGEMSITKHGIKFKCSLVITFNHALGKFRDQGGAFKFESVIIDTIYVFISIWLLFYWVFAIILQAGCVHNLRKGHP